MSKPLAELSNDDLVALFAENGIAQDEASRDATLAENSSESDEAISSLNALCWAMKDIDTELQKRGPSARLALAKLYDHPNPQVRLQAAKVSFAVAPVEARRVIEDIAKSGIMPQAGDARGTIRNLDTGFWKPA